MLKVPILCPFSASCLICHNFAVTLGVPTSELMMATKLKLLSTDWIVIQTISVHRLLH